jgi:hypothetical protein
VDFQVTVRYGTERQRYHLQTVAAADLREAMRTAADGMPEDVAAEADLVEIRPAADTEARTYLGEDT